MTSPHLLSVHLLDAAPLALLRRRPDPARVAGLLWAETMLTAPLPAGLPPRPHGAALLAAWEGEDALDEFAATSPLAERLATGWQVRLEPLRAYGAWAPLPGLGRPERAVDPEEPVVIITLGRLRLTRLPAFLRSSRPAERQAVGDPAVVLATALARPPRLVSTFSVWRTAREMRDYAVGGSGDAHLRATRAHQQRPFHHESVFARFRPYAASGSWHGLAPLTGA